MNSLSIFKNSLVIMSHLNMKGNIMTKQVITKSEAIALKELDGNPVMSTLRIAEVTGKNHFHVVRDMKEVFDNCEIRPSKFGCTYLDSQNKKQTHYLLPEREFNLIVSKYSDKYRLQLIDELLANRKELKASRERILELQLKSKDKLIEDLSSRSKEFRVIVRDGIKYHSALAIMQDEKDSAKSFKKVMREVLDIVKVQTKLTPYYKVTENGLNSKLVVEDEHGTPYYSEETLDLYHEAKEM